MLITGVYNRLKSDKTRVLTQDLFSVSCLHATLTDVALTGTNAEQPVGRGDGQLSVQQAALHSDSQLQGAYLSTFHSQDAQQHFF